MVKFSAAHTRHKVRSVGDLWPLSIKLRFARLIPVSRATSAIVSPRATIAARRAVRISDSTTSNIFFYPLIHAGASVNFKLLAAKTKKMKFSGFVKNLN